MAAKIENQSYLNEEVEVLLPKISGEAPTHFVGINGQSWLIPRGKRVMVPRKVKLVLDRAQDAQEAADEYSSEEQRKMLEIQGAPM